jgi:hypothetical protein
MLPDRRKSCQARQETRGVSPAGSHSPGQEECGRGFPLRFERRVVSAFRDLFPGSAHGQASMRAVAHIFVLLSDIQLNKTVNVKCNVLSQKNLTHTRILAILYL